MSRPVEVERKQPVPEPRSHVREVVWTECGDCRKEFTRPVVVPHDAYWLDDQGRDFCDADCHQNAAEKAQERQYEQFHGGAVWP